MKICIFTGKPDIRGGSTRYVTDFSESLKHSGHDVWLVFYQGNIFADIFRLWIRAKECDILHVIDLNPRGFVAYFVTRFVRAKLVISCLGSYSVAPLYNPKLAWGARHVYRAADAVIAISTFTKRQILDKVPDIDIAVITPSVNVVKFHPNDTEPEKAGIYMLSVGSIKRRKGYDIALRAFISAKKDIPDLRYVIVGAQIDEPEFVKSLLELTRDAGVKESVNFIKDISDEELRSIYQNASLFVLPSVNEGLHFEGFGIVFLEAAAYGLPSVGTLGNGIEDAVEDGKTAILVPQRDVEATANAIRAILQDEALRKRMKKRAREYAIEHDSSRLVSKYEELYRKIL